MTSKTKKILACGFVNFDIIATGLRGIPEPGDVVYAPQGVKFWIGGHTANLSVDLMQLGTEARKVATVAAVGDDVAGGFIEEFLGSKDLVLYLQKVRGVETGKAIVLVRDGQDRSFVVSDGANAHLNYDWVLDAIKEFDPAVLYLASGILGDFDKRVRDLLRFCRNESILTVLDVVEPLDGRWEYIHPALKFADIVHSNHLELRGITGQQDQKAGLAFLRERGVTLPILSDGGNGVVALLTNGRYLTQSPFNVRVVDPTGAGDAFCAGLVKYLAGAGLEAGLLDRIGLEELTEMLLFGQAAGASCVEEIGTTLGVSMARVRELLAEQGSTVRASTLTIPP